MKTTSKIREEISTWSYLAETLIYEHQQDVQYAILRKVENLKAELKELNESSIKQTGSN